MIKNINLKKIIMVCLVICIFIFIIILGINGYVILSVKNDIINNYEDIKDVDCILVLGAGVRSGKPSPMLEDRLKTAIELYEAGISDKIIVSGDHGRSDYDEVNVMKNYLIDNGIPSESIFMDHAGFSTYESIYRAINIFDVKRVVIVTQKYHLYRSLYIANNFDIEAYGVSADKRSYKGQLYRELREILARDKDVFKCIYKPEPTYLGEVLPVSGNGDITNDN